MDPPSPQLVESLMTSGLATEKDLARCRPLVYAFSRDLPTFDSVWVDALVRLGTLTPFQARRIHDGEASSLRIGPWLLCDWIQHDKRSDLYHARHAETGQRSLLTRWTGNPERLKVAHESLQKKQSQFPRGARNMVFPSDSLIGQGAWWTVCASVDGHSLLDLMVRQGRLPAAAVQEIGYQIATDLEQLHAANLTHGELRPENIWMTPRGQLRILQPTLLALLEPGDPLHASLPLSSYDGMAPERCDPDAKPSAKAVEVYALGCLLWHLLAGRPPHPAADHLLKISAHQTEEMPLISDWAPDVPHQIEMLIRQMTSRKPGVRPDIQEVRATLAGSRNGSLQSLVHMPDSVSVRTEGKPTKARQSVGRFALATVALLLLAVGLWWGPGLVSDYVKFSPSQAEATTNNETIPPEPVTGSADALLELPAPDAKGIVQLAPGRYAASPLQSTGDLLITGPDSGEATIVIEPQQSWSLSGDRILISLVHLEVPHERTGAACDVRCQELAVDRVQVTTSSPGETTSDRSLISWNLLRSSDVTSGRLYVRDSAFLNVGSLFDVAFPLQQATFENLLQTGPGNLLQLQQGVKPGGTAAVTFVNCTLRDTGAAVSLGLDDSNPGGHLTLGGKESLLLIGDDNALVEFHSGRLPPDWVERIRISGEGLIFPADHALAGYRFDSGELRPLDSQSINIDGLLSGNIEFADNNLNTPEASNVIKADIPLRQSQLPPGADTTRLVR
ncbi:MAG: protein kinase [Planctomycetaceae bacterium]|nr:protein kinase [Planctomycetaceae bacterium]